MTDLPHPMASGPKAPSAASKKRALVAALRSTLVTRLGVRAARSIGIGLALWFAVSAWLAAKGPDGDGWTAGIAARGSALIAGYAGAVVALSLAASSKKNAELEAGVRALAEARGFSARSIIAAEVAAFIRVVGEVIALPIAALSFVCLLLSRDSSLDALLPIVGAAIFGGGAAIALGSVASACRRWGGARARSSLLAVVLLPWIVGGALLEGRGGEYVSIPGLLGLTWRLLTGGQG